MGTPRYTDDFKAGAVKMVLEGKKGVVQVAKELCVTERSIRDWLKRHEASQRSEFVRIQELERENKRLRKELAEAQEAVVILKKTAAILSKP